MTVARVFIGWDHRQEIAAEVTMFSIFENATYPVDVDFIAAGQGPLKDFNRTGVTDFSYARFMIPWIMNYQGIALFMDCDVLVLGDVDELLSMPMDGYAVRVVKHAFRGQTRPRVWSAVMLMDCAKLRCWAPAHVEAVNDNALMRLLDLPNDQIGALPPEWHVLAPHDGTDSVDGAQLIHWSHLASPDDGEWIERSGSALWMDWRDRWRAAGG